MADAEDEMGSAQPALLYFSEKEFSPRFGSNFFTVSLQGHSIDGVPSACGGQFAKFHIQVRRGRDSWVVKRRFSEFDKLQLEMRRDHPDIEEEFPALPPKTCCRSLEETFLEKRSDLLAEYIENLLVTFSNHKSLQADAESLYKFLNIRLTK